MKKILIALAVAVFMAGCASTKPAEEVKVDDKSKTGGETKTTVTPPTTSGTPGGGVVGSKVNTDAKAGTLATRSVYFDYDKDTVKPEFTAMLQAHAKFMSENKGRKMRLEGNADERGSREYNMALGQRRANAVKQALTALGVSGDRIETISFGEDKPKATGHDEAAWAQNRRVDVVYDGE